MYHAIVRRKVRNLWRTVGSGAGGYRQAVALAAPDLRFRFIGDTPMGAELRGREAFADWFERFERTFPGLRLTLQDIVVQGPPWNTSVVTRLTVRGTPAPPPPRGSGGRAGGHGAARRPPRRYRAYAPYRARSPSSRGWNRPRGYDSSFDLRCATATRNGPLPVVASTPTKPTRMPRLSGRRERARCQSPSSIPARSRSASGSPTSWRPSSVGSSSVI